MKSMKVMALEEAALRRVVDLTSSLGQATLAGLDLSAASQQVEGQGVTLLAARSQQAEALATRCVNEKTETKENFSVTVDTGLQRGLCEDERGQWEYCNLHAGIVSIRYSA